jgi:hypothetical protein
MPFEFCIPTTGITVPSEPDRYHEIKYDGYRLRLERELVKLMDHWEFSALVGSDATRASACASIVCPACTRLHFLNRKTGRLLGQDDK